MVVLSLFDGMSCGQIALEELGITPTTYYASEIDKHAIKQTALNFPNTVQLGSVVDVNVSELERIDLLLGGSPCQSFSFAGKRKGMATTCEIQITKLEQYLELKQAGFEFEGQSYLFWEYMRILTEIRKYNPDVLFLLENVEMGKKWERVLSEGIGVFAAHINSALVSAQNRKRIYFTNIKTEPRGLFGELHSAIPQPKDRGILLKDILETDVEEKYYLSEKMLNYFDRKEENNNNGFGFSIGDENKKTNTLLARYGKDGKECLIKVGRQLNPKANQDKASCFTAGAHSGGNHSDMDLIIVAQRGRNPENPNDRTKGANLEQTFEPNTTGKTNCLTSVAKDNYVMCLTPKRTDYGKEIRKGYEAGTIEAQRKEISSLEPRNDGKTNTLSTVQKDNLLNNNSRIRRLTPTECARLQTVPEWYKWEMSGLYYKIHYLCSELNNIKSWEKLDVKLSDAQTKLQLNKLNYAQNITSNPNEIIHWKFQDQLSTNQLSALGKDAIGTNKQKKVFAFCTISDLLDMAQVKSLQKICNGIESVSIVMKKWGYKDQEGCVQSISKCLNDTETHCLLKLKDKVQVQVGILDIQMEFLFTKQQWKNISEEVCIKEKLYTISTLIKRIMKSVIYTYAKAHPNIRVFIQNLKITSDKELILNVFHLSMENTYSSDSSIYKLCGNGWTIEVVKHILSFLPNTK